MKKILYFILLLSLPASLAGQVISSELIVSTNPSGARVVLDGDVTIDGLSPVGLPGELQGKYKITISEEGYETFRKSLFLSPNNPIDLTFSLKTKTRFKATIRSLIIPGWGQMYSGRTGKGLLFTVLAAGATGYYFMTDKDFSERLDDYDRVNFQYNHATTEAEKTSLYSLLGKTKQEAYDAENKRAIAIGGIIGIWGLNLIDALLFYPVQKGNLPVKSLSIKPNPEQGGAQIVFSYRF